jgi:predicted amidohydrolase YtcJ
MLIRRATLLDGRVADIRVTEQITDVAPTLTPLAGEAVVDARLGAAIPGLHDHHLHLMSTAAALDSVVVGPPAVHTEQQLAHVVASATPDGDGWIRAVAYHESVAGDLDRARLDKLRANSPLRVQHRSGAMWILNSAALDKIGVPGHPDGRIPSDDETLAAIPRRRPDLSGLSRRLARYGVTGVTDATPDLRDGDARCLTAAFTQRVHWLAPGKKILHDHQLDFDGLTEWISATHTDGVPVAIHCVTTAQLVVAIAALRAAGQHHGDRIEHAAMVPDGCVGDLAELGITVVTQPNFIAERGDQYVDDIPADEHAQLWRLASLMHAGIAVAGSTDAPFGAADPWAAMRAAVTRVSATGRLIGPGERVEPRVALQMFLGSANRPARPRDIAVGEPGDVCVLTVPPDEALAELASDMVSMTVVGGAALDC